MRPSLGLLHRALGATLRVSGLLPVAKWLDRQRPGILRVLVYHRVADPARLEGGDPGMISASPQDFEKQMRYLAGHYRPVGGKEVVDALREGARLPPHAVLVTFDDGYRDFLTDAWPILRRHRVPAVLFVPTAFPGGGRRFWWDVLHDAVSRGAGAVTLPGIGTFTLGTPQQRSAIFQYLLARLTRLRPEQIAHALGELGAQLAADANGPPPVLTWDELRRLTREGLTVASHTRTHPSLPALSEDEMAEEISGARADLERELGSAPPLFSYPFGHRDPRAVSAVREAGIVAAFTAFTPQPTVNIPDRTDPLLLRREAVNGEETFVEFCLNLTSLYVTLQSAPRIQAWRSRVRRHATSYYAGCRGVDRL